MTGTLPTDDETFVRALRARVDTLAPRIDVDTDRVLPTARRRRRRRRTVVSGLCALAVVVGGVGAASYWSEPSPTHPSQIAPASGGDAAAPVPDGRPQGNGPADGPYWRVRTLTTSTETTSDGRTEERSQGITYWTARDPEGDSYRAFEGDDAMEPSPGSTFGSLVIDGEHLRLGWDELDTLPTDPAELDALLRESVRAEVGTVNEDALAQKTWNLLHSGPTSPAVRDGLWATLTGLTASTPLGAVQDTQGRTGEGLEWVGQDQSNRIVRLVYDTAEHRLLELTFDVDLSTSGSEPTADAPTAGSDGDGAAALQHVVLHTTYLDEGEVAGPPPASGGPDCWKTC
ncbi:hypothetical protein [Cellulosimicrobium sp. SJTW-1]|uniref:hypothetical protein n=1 Tax=Cellulosimicrobium sp. SJTW-1 TaxID=3078082 RepID=UPI0039EC72FE